MGGKNKSLDKVWEVSTTRTVDDQITKVLKDAITEDDIIKMVSEFNIVPIDYMRKNDRFSGRFEDGKYNSFILKNEIKVLDAKQGGNQWLLGERFNLARQNKAYREWGYSTFEEYIENELPYSRTTVFSYMAIFRRFSYADSIKIGSKLQLIPAYIADGNEDKLKGIISSISDMDYEAAQNFMSEIRDKTVLSTEINTSLSNEVDEENDNTIVTQISNDGKHEMYTPTYTKIKPKKVTKEGQIVFKDEDEARSIKPYNLVYSFGKKAELEIFDDVLADMWSLIVKRMATKMSGGER